MAPEIFLHNSYSKAIDIWSLGILMFNLLNEGGHPFLKPGDTKNNYIQRIIKEDNYGKGKLSK